MKIINNSKITFSFLVITISTILFSFVSVNAMDEKTQINLGKMEYLSNCGSCHGRDAKGDGPIATILTVKPSDLTIISQKYKGVFPKERIYKIIDGRNMIKAHGDSLMPVWGQRFTILEYKAADAVAYLPDDLDIQALVFGRIISLLVYLESIQAK